MNLIISGFHEEVYFPLVSKILKHFDVKYCHLTLDKSKLKVSSKIETIFHDFNDLNAGVYDINWEKVTPLDEGLIEKMNDCEVVVLKMMDRLPYELTYDERKSLYLKHLRYWNHIIDKNKIELFLTSASPHEIHDFVIYCLCKLKKIPTIFFFQTRISDTVTMMEDWEANDTAIQVRYKELLKKYQYVDESKVLLTGRFKRYYELNTGRKNPSPFWALMKTPSHNVIKNLVYILINLKFSRFLTLIGKPNLLIRSINTYVGRIILDNQLTRFYNRNAVIPDLSKKYIYFPLHVQPELSTSPLAGVFVNQILIVQMIAYFLPKDVYIYIKENSSQTAIGRSIEFYRELLKISQVRFISSTFNTFDLTNNSIAVVTATGTVGLEALYRCKPVLMFGHNFYQYAKGVFQIKSNLDCKRALKMILTDNYRPKIKDFKIFLKALEDTTIEGYINVDYKKDTHVNDIVSNRNILYKLINEIELVCNL